MGRKTCASRAKYAKAICAGPSPSAHSASTRLDFDDVDIAERDPLSGTPCIAREDKLSREPDLAGSSMASMATVSPKKPHNRDSRGSTASCGSRKIVCLQCEMGGQMLVCSVTDCGVGIHDHCLRTARKFDDFGNFICPRCSYKRALENLALKKKRVLMAKQALSKFLGLEEVQKDGNNNRKQASLSPLGNQNHVNYAIVAIINGDDHQCGRQEGGGEKSNNAIVAINGDGQQCATEESGGEKSNNGDLGTPSSKDNQEADKQFVPSTTYSPQALQMIKSDSGSEGQHGKTHSDYVDSPEKGSSHSSIPAGSPCAFRSSPRKRAKLKNVYAEAKQSYFRWTDEEEQMLEEGVKKYSESMNKNIPWRKILEFGAHVFHTARKPDDLKEKWKKISRKLTN